ncbi:Uncharacterised protein [Vibrio cholerae]|nr:Uncharacterised protein [Vibrio cholerae]
MALKPFSAWFFNTSLPWAIRGPQSAALPVFGAPEIPAE